MSTDGNHFCSSCYIVQLRSNWKLYLNERFLAIDCDIHVFFNLFLNTHYSFVALVWATDLFAQLQPAIPTASPPHKGRLHRVLI